MRGGTTAFGKRGGSRLMATAAVSAGPAMASTAIAEEIPDDPPGTGIRWPLLSIAILIALVVVSRDLVAQGEWWRIFTAPLMHGDISHIVGNGIALFFAARFLEM